MSELLDFVTENLEMASPLWFGWSGMNAAQRNEQEEEDWFRSLLNEEEDDGQQQQQQQEQEEGEYGETMQGHVDCGKMVRGPYVSEYVKGKREREREQECVELTRGEIQHLSLYACTNMMGMCVRYVIRR